MCQQSSVRGAYSTVCSHTWRKECRKRDGRGGGRAPPHFRIKSGAIKCKCRQTAPPQLVGEFVLKWKWGWWCTWRLALRLTWKERKRQLLIFSFDLWLPLVFHTNADLWRSLTAHCYWRDYWERTEGWPLALTVSGFIHFIFYFHVCPFFTSCVLLLSPISHCWFSFVSLSVCLSGFQTLYLFTSLFVVCFCLHVSFILSILPSSFLCSPSLTIFPLWNNPLQHIRCMSEPPLCSQTLRLSLQTISLKTNPDILKPCDAKMRKMTPISVLFLVHRAVSSCEYECTLAAGRSHQNHFHANAMYGWVPCKEALKMPCGAAESQNV